MVKRTLKHAVLRASRALGLFRLSRHLTRRSLRILCYHGTALSDETAFRPTLFIEPAVFEERLRHLKAHRFPVLGLDEAVQRLVLGTLPDHATVITIDDGFFGTYRHAVAALRRHGLPATLYVTTYYAQKRRPIFRLMAQYAFWASRRRTVSTGGLGVPGLAEVLTLGADRENDPALWQIIRHGEEVLDEPGRAALLQRLGSALDVDLDRLCESRALSLMTPEEIEDAARAGLDIQLHTHRHRLPLEREAAQAEVIENRSVLEPLVGRRLEHLCYPSGEWSHEHLAWLAELGIRSATTCDVGFSDRETPSLALKRVFDGAHVSALEFEAELHGYNELIRRAWARLRTIPSRRSKSPNEAPRPARGPGP